MITKTLFGNLNGKDVYCYLLDNGNGLTAEFLSYGGIIKSICFNGVDVALGRPTLEEYLNNSGCLGAAIGRNSNRIANAKFNLNGKEYTLFANNNQANLHGGKEGFDKKIWNVQEQDGAEPALIFTYTAADMEEGFPGKAHVTMTYSLTQDNGLSIHYQAVSDKDTLMNLTNHTYFNLNGHDSGVVDNQTLQLNSSFYTPNCADCYPTGEVLCVDGCAFDFKAPKTFGEGFTSKHPQVDLFEGYDHNFMLDGEGYRLGAVAKGDKTGIVMEMYTDAPAVQLYTANCLTAGRNCKDGKDYGMHHGFCLETQYVPNAINIPYLVSPILKAGETYDSTTTYKFKK